MVILMYLYCFTALNTADPFVLVGFNEFKRKLTINEECESRESDYC